MPMTKQGNSLCQPKFHVTSRLPSTPLHESSEFQRFAAKTGKGKAFTKMSKSPDFSQTHHRPPTLQVPTSQSLVKKQSAANVERKALAQTSSNAFSKSTSNLYKQSVANHMKLNMAQLHQKQETTLPQRSPLRAENPKISKPYNQPFAYTITSRYTSGGFPQPQNSSIM